MNESFFDVRKRMTPNMKDALLYLNNDIKLKMGKNPKNTSQNNEIFGNLLLRVEADHKLATYETYLIGVQSDYPTDWATWRTAADGKYRSHFEKLREHITVKNLKLLIEAILKEVRRVGPGEFVEPNGTVHDVGDETHWEWALAHVGNTSRFDTLNPLRELLLRGWIRVIYSYHDSIIMVEHKKQITKQQMAYLEDQAEETRWAVIDDDGVELYRSADCITKENPLGEVTQKDLKSTMPPIRAWDIKKSPNQPTQQNPKMDMMTLDNLKSLKDKAGRSLLYLKKNKPEEYQQYGPLIFKQWQRYDWEIKRRLKYINQRVKESTEPSIGGSYADQSTNVAWNDITQMERDPLTDPELNGKLNESSYKFDEFGWLSTMDGFNKPIDVYYGSILLGVIESRPDAYVIIVVMGPDKHYRVEAGPTNKFKTKIDAAETLHRTWKTLRTKQV